MPMYDYRCKNCSEKFEELVFSSSTSDEKIECPNCKEYKSERLFSAPMVSIGGSSNGVSTSQSSGCGNSGFS